MPATFSDLVALMDRLRSPTGCPWDREQTYATLAPMLLEEAYEAFEAVEEAREGKPEELRDELGDLLFQIVFYAQVARERNEFTIDDVTADDSATVLLNWETMKAEERRAAGKKEDARNSLLDGVSSKAPALMEAHQLSTKAARVGFDWRNVDEIFDKLQEEIEELRVAIRNHSDVKDEANHARVREEIGDLLFAATNIARHLQVEPEAALKLTNRKFRRRFRHIENALDEQGKTFDSTSIDEMENLWQQAKQKT